jgi:hypothetical protein
MKHLIKIAAIAILQLCSIVSHAQLTCSIVKIEVHKYDIEKLLLTLDVMNTTSEPLYLNEGQVKRMLTFVSNKYSDTTSKIDGYLEHYVRSNIIVGNVETVRNPSVRTGCFFKDIPEEMINYENDFINNSSYKTVKKGEQQYIILEPNKYIRINTIMSLVTGYMELNKLSPAYDQSKLRADMVFMIDYYDNLMQLGSQQVQLSVGKSIKDAVVKLWLSM